MVPLCHPGDIREPDSCTFCPPPRNPSTIFLGKSLSLCSLAVRFLLLKSQKINPGKAFFLKKKIKFRGSDPTWWFCPCRWGLGHGHSRRGHPPRRRWWPSGLSARRRDFHIHLMGSCYPTLERTTFTSLLELSAISNQDLFWKSRSNLTLKLSCA